MTLATLKMRAFRRAVVPCSVVFGFVSIVLWTVAQVSKPPNSTAGAPTFSDPDQAAQHAIETLGKLMAAAPNASNGFGITLDELPSARLGKPVEAYSVRADELSQFHSGDSAEKLLHDEHVRIYPIVIAGAGRALVRIKHDATGWTPVAWGEEALARNLVNAIGTSTGSPGGSVGPVYIAVEIPSMHLSFIARNPATLRTPLTFRSLNSSAELHVNWAAKGVGVYEMRSDFTAEGQGAASASTVFSNLAPKAKVALQNRMHGPG